MQAWRLCKRLCHSGALFLPLIILAGSALAESGKSGKSSQTVTTPNGTHILKWVDEKGVTHYGDTMPVQDSGRARSEMTKQGIMVNRKPAEQTPETAPKKDPEQDRRDRALLASYTTEQEIDLTRDRNLELAQTNGKALQTNLETAQRQLDANKKQADAYASKKKKVPDDLASDIKNSQEKVDKIQSQLKQNQADMEATRTRFDQDKLRFRELKAAQGNTAKQP